MPILDQLTQAVGTQRGVAAADALCAALVDLAQVDSAAISLILDGANSGTLGASTPDARVHDELQFTFGEGPCLDSVSELTPILVTDLADHAHRRWPGYVPAMMARRIGSVFAIPVVLDGIGVGALDLYRAGPSALSADQMDAALSAAELAGVPILDLISPDGQAAHADPAELAWQQWCMLGRHEIDQATGMLMAQLNVEPAEALVLLRAHAYASNRSATDVAREILARRLRLTIIE